MTIFDERKAEAAVDSKLTHIYCSIDGASQAVYEKYRRGGNLVSVLENMKLLLEVRKRRRKKHPFVTWKYLIFPHNYHEIKHARTLAAEIGVDEFEVFTGTVNVGFWNGGQYQEGCGLIPMLGPEFCNSLWSSLFINPGGEVTPCCQSFRNVDVFGNLLNQDLDAVWNGPRYLEARRLFQKAFGTKQEIPYPCRDCSIIPKAQVRVGAVWPKEVFHDCEKQSDV
jgi:radical SAM protein with 4Fe4S-binding SPASM domain